MPVSPAWVPARAVAAVLGCALAVVSLAAPASADEVPADSPPAAAEVVAPASPVGLVALPRDRQVALRWQAPAEGEVQPVSYRVTVTPGDRVLDVAAPALGVDVADLQNGLAHRFEVTAVREAATSAAASATAVPRRALVLSGVAPASRTARYGSTTTVAAVVRDAAGSAAGGVRLVLQARRAGSSTWSGVGSATSGTNGRAALRATLRGTSDLRVVHLPDADVAPSAGAGRVVVTSAVTAASAASVGAAYAHRVTGRVSPAGPVGARVQLQRLTSAGWRPLATGALTSSTGYRVSWTPPRASRYRLRVVRPAVGAVAAGSSAAFSVAAVDTRKSVAREIVRDGGIVLAQVHPSGVRDLATARRNLADSSAGLAARRSSYENAPGGRVLLDLRVLRALRRIGQLAGVSVSEVAGGSHAPRSDHYGGRALDVNKVNGHPVRRGSGYMLVVRACRAAGASQVFHPGYDPYGGHSNHVHCSFG